MLESRTVAPVGARLMAGQLTLDQPVAVQIRCPQPQNTVERRYFLLPSVGRLNPIFTSGISWEYSSVEFP